MTCSTSCSASQRNESGPALAADVIRYLRWFTFLSADELAELEEATAECPHERAAQRRLARELTTLVHGQAATESV